MARASILNERHRQLGSQLDGDTWNDMPVPWSYSTNPDDEVVAVRSAAGLFDISAINVVDVTGPDALAVIDRIVPIDVSRLKPGLSRLAAVVDEKGALSDDVMVSHLGKDFYRISHGSGDTQKKLAQYSEGRQVQWAQNFDIHLISVQGPKSPALLQPHLDIALDKLPYFASREATLFGRKALISRGGYSGEQGFEVACAAADAVALWDALLETGAPLGTMACAWTALDIARVEAGLLFFPYEMPEGDTTPWEVNLGWALDADKTADYVGKAAVLKSRGKERFFQGGVTVKADRAVVGGARITVDGKEAGVVTSPTFSRYLMQSLALVHLKPPFNTLGTQVQIADDAGPLAATVVKAPFYDPMRLRARIAA